MDGEYIIKLRDKEDILIPKEQWDGSKDNDTFRFIPLGPGIYIEVYDRFDKKCPAIIGIAQDINREDNLGSVLVLYEYENGKYTHEWIKSISGTLRFEVKDILKSKEIFNILVKAIKGLHPDLDDEEFLKIVKSVVLAYVLYRYIKSSRLEPDLNIREYYYKLYRYILRGKKDYETYITITGVFNKVKEITPEYINRLKEMFEEAHADLIDY